MRATRSLNFFPPDFMALIIFGARTAYNVFLCNMLHLRYPKKKFTWCIFP